MTDEDRRAQHCRENEAKKMKAVREIEDVIDKAITCAQFQVNRARRNARKDEADINAARRNNFECVIKHIAAGAVRNAEEAKTAADKAACAANRANRANRAEAPAHEAEAAEAVVEAEAALARVVSARANLAKFVEEFGNE